MRGIGLALLLSFAVVAFAQEKKSDAKKAESTSMKGYVVDQMCAKGMAKKDDPMARAAKHSKECALEEACAASGYGVFYDNGKWVKFDAKGDKLAKEMFEKSKKTNDFMAEVKGVMKAENLNVASLVEVAAPKDPAKKPSKKEETHDH